MPKTPTPTLTQRLALQRMLATTGTIHRLPGGFWVSGTVPMKTSCAPGGGQVPDSQGKDLKEVYCDVQTVRAMEKRGWVKRLHSEKEEWKDPRVITTSGLDALKASA